MNMALQIELVYQRALLLRQRATELPVQPELLEKALEELTLVLEELQASQDELRLQNQTLIATQQEVETERQRYQDLFVLAPDGYLVTDQAGVIQEANRAIAVMLNVPPAYLIGKPISVFIAESIRPAFYATLNQLNQWGSSQRLQTQEWEIQICPCDGTPLEVAISLSMTCDANSNGVSYRWLLRDITQQKQISLLQAQLNTSLEHQVQAHTIQLRQALDFEATLKRITDKVRDSLDEAQIMQTVVRELAETLKVSCCNASQYNLEQDTASIEYEHTHLDRPYKNRTLRISSNPEIYRQLLQHRIVQFCPIPPDPQRGKLVMVATPILDDQGVLGDLWLIDLNTERNFDEQDVRLVQQIANQCAIAIRQSRLYQASQRQVQELQQLHQLKDNFLSTVSHELRTPLSNMNMAIRMLDLIVKQPEEFTDKQPRLTRYLEVLQTQCQQEIHLIDDLLDLSRIDANPEPLVLTSLDFNTWFPQIVFPFEERLRKQQQHLQIDLPADLPALTTDAALLRRILTELLNNACKYTPAQETIAITVKALAPNLQVSISNSGVNLPSSELERLFERFYRVPTHDPWKHGGTGLGLALVKKQVNQIGGAITVSNPAGWIIFTLQIPWSLESEENISTLKD